MTSARMFPFSSAAALHDRQKSAGLKASADTKMRSLRRGRLRILVLAIVVGAVAYSYAAAALAKGRVLAAVTRWELLAGYFVGNIAFAVAMEQLMAREHWHA